MSVKLMEESIASEAAAFYEVGSEIDKKVDEYINGLADGEVANKRELIKQIVAMINYAFSCELFLKSRLDEIAREQNRKHGLEDLFLLQDNEFKEYVKDKVIDLMKINRSCYDDTMFYEELKRNSDVFHKWRYYYEGTVSKMNLDFIRVFAIVLFWMYECQLSILSDENESES